MKDYLYILPFTDGQYFKIGISGNSFNRVNHHNNTYDINYDESFVFLGKRQVISSLEYLLLSTTKRIDCFEGLDGHTEVRNIKELPNCLSLINGFQERGILKKERLSEVIDKPFYVNQHSKTNYPKPKKEIFKPESKGVDKKEMEFIISTLKKETQLNKFSMMIISNVKNELRKGNINHEDLLRQTINDIGTFLKSSPDLTKEERIKELENNTVAFFNP